MVFNFMLQLNITGTVQFSQNFVGQNITVLKTVNANASFLISQQYFLLKDSQSMNFYLYCIHDYTFMFVNWQYPYSLLCFSLLFVYFVHINFLVIYLESIFSLRLIHAL